jgi:predicted signal transduction protein with EAL and GGDEF domain
MRDLALQIHRNGTLLEVSGRLENDPLLSSGQGIGKNIYDLMPPDFAQPVMRCVERALGSGELQGFEYQVPAGSSDVYEVKVIAGGEEKVLVLISNVAEYKQAVEKVRHLAYHDILTNLPNRILFLDRLKQAMAHAERDKRQLAVLFLDLDNFKHARP